MFSKRVEPVFTATIKLTAFLKSQYDYKSFVFIIFTFNVHVILNDSAKSNSY